MKDSSRWVEKQLAIDKLSKNFSLTLGAQKLSRQVEISFIASWVVGELTNDI